jgi:pimeloyl-ACP methyl ester carboxylesterase
MDKASWRSPDLGAPRTLELSQGRLRVFERGEGSPIVLVHGVVVNANLWRKVVPELAKRHRVVTLDMPLGAHTEPMPGADLSPPGLAEIVADAFEELGLEDVTLVGNDTGGAICQIVATRHPERIGRLVLTPCDAYDNFLPAMFKPLEMLARVPGAIWGIGQSLRLTVVRHAPNGFGWLVKSGPDAELTRAWVEPALKDAGVRRDIAKILRGISERYTMEAAQRLADFDRPTLIAWAPEDRFFKFEHAERLAATIPNARLERIEDSYTYVSLDQPRRLANLISAFVRESQSSPAAAG